MINITVKFVKQGVSDKIGNFIVRNNTLDNVKELFHKFIYENFNLQFKYYDLQHDNCTIKKQTTIPYRNINILCFYIINIDEDPNKSILDIITSDNDTTIFKTCMCCGMPLRSRSQTPFCKSCR